MFFPKKKWSIVVYTKESSVNLYGALLALKKLSESGGMDKEAVKYAEKWMRRIKKHVPDIEERGYAKGKLHVNDLSPLKLRIKLNEEEKEVMESICSIMYSKLLLPKIKGSWIRNQGVQGYEYALKNYKGWTEALESETNWKGIFKA
ncbi:MAG: hypothetical protein GY862_11225 [Gammaproteobacteria bacterium]|nr:hypothetical protein [Gammaproteobacteria bacterium]